MRATLFGAVAADPAGERIAGTLDSLFRTTELLTGDRVVVCVAGEGAHTGLRQRFPRAEWLVVRGGYSDGASAALREAARTGADCVLCDTTTVFTPGWREPFAPDLEVIMVSLATTQISYTADGVSWGGRVPAAQLVAYSSHLPRIAEFNRSRHSGYRHLLASAFPCVKIPAAVAAAVGGFDARFTSPEAAAYDYCLRSQLAGYCVLLAPQSFVVSVFPDDTSAVSLRAPDAAAFEAKWGNRLSRVVLSGDREPLGSDPEVSACARRAEFKSVVESLAAADGKEHPSFRPRVAAVYCVHEDDRWLEASLESVYPACDAIVVLLGERPWNGEPRDNSSTVGILRSFPDPEGKITVTSGAWPSETDQRNAGMEIVAAGGFDYCLVVDADEVYETAELSRMIRHVSSRRYVPAWRIGMATYWKLDLHRIDPPEPYKPAAFLRPGKGRFTDKREIGEGYSETIPEELGVFHHLSYARSDDEVLRKITTFSHAHEMIPGWFENVWKRWDSDPSMEDIHPCWPSAYKRAVKVQVESLPSALRKRVR